MLLRSNKLCLRVDSNISLYAIINRWFHLSAIKLNKKNFRKFSIPNKTGQFEHNKLPRPLLENEFDYPVVRDTLHIKHPGVWFGRKFYYVKEMEPQLIVPNLDGFQLKPYVSYRCPDITQSEFTARELFNSCLADDIIEKFKNGEQIDVSVSEEEVESARIRAKQTGADLFLDKRELVIE